ncbi:MAG: hypothetical protein D6722_12865 [Bacteroidetes bacterium]|nr:MAG: hypothetical protein D6722_12865 [Bacteroidota bacterium]
MTWRSLFFAVTVCILSLATSCRKGPKVIESEPVATATPSGIFAGGTGRSGAAAPTSPTGLPAGVHRVVVQEVLPTERYVYLRVSESGQDYWIATRKMEAAPGAVFFYRDGLRKTHFESKEYNRVFDEMILVSQLVPEAHGGADLGRPASVQPPMAAPSFPAPAPAAGEVPRLRITELVADPQRYAGQLVEVHGECVKLNANIMDRNWIHLRDGSQDDYDLVLTAAEPVREGTHATFRARVGVNRDFGAGYAYALILEEGVRVE